MCQLIDNSDMVMHEKNNSTGVALPERNLLSVWRSLREDTPVLIHAQYAVSSGPRKSVELCPKKCRKQQFSWVPGDLEI